MPHVTCTGSHVSEVEETSLLTSGTAALLCFIYLFLMGVQPESQWVLLSHSVSSSFNLLKEPVESERQPSCLCTLLEGLELPTQATRQREREKTNDDRRGGRWNPRWEEEWIGRNEEAGKGGVCVCVLFTSRHASGLRVRWWCCTAGTASCSPAIDGETIVSFVAWKIKIILSPNAIQLICICMFIILCVFWQVTSASQVSQNFVIELLLPAPSVRECKPACVHHLTVLPSSLFPLPLHCFDSVPSAVKQQVIICNTGLTA